MDDTPHGQNLRLAIALDIDVVPSARQRNEVPLAPVVAAIVIERCRGRQDRQQYPDHVASTLEAGVMSVKGGSRIRVDAGGSVFPLTDFARDLEQPWCMDMRSITKRAALAAHRMRSRSK